MADHIAEQLLDAVQTALTGLATTGSHIYRARPQDRAAQTAELPGLLLYMSDEVIEVTGLGLPYTMRRSQSLRVRVLVNQTGAIDQSLNQIRKEVEIALAAGLSVASSTLYAYYAGMAEPELSGEGERPAMAADLTFAVDYFTASNVPDALA